MFIINQHFYWVIIRFFNNRFGHEHFAYLPFGCILSANANAFNLQTSTFGTMKLGLSHDLMIFNFSFTSLLLIWVERQKYVGHVCGLIVPFFFLKKGKSISHRCRVFDCRSEFVVEFQSKSKVDELMSQG